MTVAEDQRSPASDQIEVSIAVDIPDRRAVSLRDEHGVRADGPTRTHRGVHASRNDGLRPLEDLLAALGRHWPERSLEIPGAASLVWHNHSMSSKLQLVGILVVLGFGRVASADADVTMTVAPAHRIEAVVNGVSRVPLSQLRLRDPRGVVVPATEVVDFKHGTETIAIAIVVEGQEIWMGNDDFEPHDSPARYQGALKGMKRAIEALDLANTMPAGSLGTIITYDERPRTKLPLGPIETFDARVLGTQKDYYGRIGYSLVQATALAIGALETAPTHKKLLLVIGDGNDTNPEAAKGQLADLKKRAAQGGIQVAAIIYKGVLSEPSSGIFALHSLAQTANSHEGIEDAMKEAVRRATSQYTVRFDGTRLDWDGTAQDLTMLVGANELEPVTVQMGPARTPSSETPWYFRWWAQLAAGVLLVGLILVGQRLRAGRLMI